MNKWTEDETNTLTEMRNRGCAYKEIAAVLGRTAAECRDKMKIKKALLKSAAENRERTAALADRIREMFEQGMGDREICKELNIGANKLNGIKRMHGIARTPKQVSLLVSRLNSARARDENNMPTNKKTICWTCKNSMVNCKKPVDGWTAKQIPYKTVKGEDVPCWLVSKCPNYDPEPYAKKRGREK